MKVKTLCCIFQNSATDVYANKKGVIRELVYMINQIVIGTEAHYQLLLSDVEALGNEVDMDNTRIMFKVGYKF